MNSFSTPIRIAIADSHVMFREGISSNICDSQDFEIVMHADNFKDLVEKLEISKDLPDICILDISMPNFNGWRMLSEIKKKWLSMKVMILTALNSVSVAKSVFRHGGNGYLCKNSDIHELKLALKKVYVDGIYIPANMHSHILTSIVGNKDYEISPKEMKFLEYCCDDYTYKEIAAKMLVSTRTVEGYRDSLFFKLNVNTRMGLALYALRNGIGTL